MLNIISHNTTSHCTINICTIICSDHSLLLLVTLIWLFFHQTEADISDNTNKWIHILVSWSKELGLTLYIDGVQRGGDLGGLATSGYEAAPQEENLRFGRSLSNDQTSFASFYIASFAIFRQSMSSAMAYQIYKYYIANGKLW